MNLETQQILARLDEIKSELNIIKERIIDVDLILTDDDIASITEAEKNLKEGKTKRL